MESLEKGHIFRRFPQDFVCSADDCPFDRDQVADQLARRPAPFSGRRLPLVGRDRARRTQQFALRASQILDDGRD